MAGIYETTVLADGPIAFYRLDETSGTTAVDQVAGHDATIAGAPTMAQPPLYVTDFGIGTSMTLANVATTFLTLPASLAIATSDPGISLEFWANFAATSGNIRFRLGIGAAGGLFSVSLPLSGPAVNVAAGNTPAAINQVIGGSITGAVHHWCVTYQNSSPFTCNLYKDGVLQATGTASVLSIAISTGILGTSANLDKYDSIAIYNKALTAAQVLAHFNTGSQARGQVNISPATKVAVNGTGRLAARVTISPVTSVSVSSPTPTATVTLDVYRSLAGANAWTRIATGITAPALGQSITFDDYGAASWQAYDYQVFAVDALGSGSPYTLFNTSVSWQLGVWLHDPADPNDTAHYFGYDNGVRNETLTPEVAMLSVDGRARPIAEFSGRDARSISVFLTMPWDSQAHASPDYEALKAFASAHKTICYRDHRGRKLYGIIAAVPEIDELLRSTTTLVVTETDFSESV